jgi:large subunit ribosomal protein L23
MAQSLSHIILRPRVTEKAAYKAESKVYTFEIPKDATKAQVAKAITALYKVTPVKIAVARTPAKVVMKKGKYGKSQSIKKAYVYLKKSDTIEFI